MEDEKEDKEAEEAYQNDKEAAGESLISCTRNFKAAV